MRPPAPHPSYLNDHRRPPSRRGVSFGGKLPKNKTISLFHLNVELLKDVPFTFTSDNTARTLEIWGSNMTFTPFILRFPTRGLLW